MHIKAKQAMDKAEEFIREKQMRKQTAILCAAKRAMQQKGGFSAWGGHGRRRHRCMEDDKQGET
jgi:hypothetical protein